MKWTAIVVDDEPMARRRLLTLLSQDDDVEVIGEYGAAEPALEAIAEEVPDLLFLDVQMPGMDGFELLESLQDGDGVAAQVIFVTAHEEHAVRAFDSEATDYLLKPFSDARFRDAMTRGKQQLRSRQVEELLRRLVEMDPRRNGPAREVERPRGDGAPIRKILVRTKGKKVFVDTAMIDWIEAEDYHTRLHVGEGSYLVRRTMNWLEQRLDERQFVRIHRSYIVNLDRIVAVEPWSAGSYDVLLRSGAKLRLSAARKEMLEQMIGQRI